MNMQYQYIIKGDGIMALPVHSDLNCIEFENHIKDQTKKLHPKGHDTVWRWGVIEFINPKVISVDGFMNNGPALIGMK
jgi:hypothetical protein